MAYAETPHGKFYYFKPDAIGQAIAEGKFWDEHYRPYIEQLKPGQQFVDVGANIGFFTIQAGLRGCAVMACEPDYKVYKVLKQNIVANGLEERVLAHCVPLYDHSGTVLGMNPEWLDGRGGRMPDPEEDDNSGGLSLVPDPTGLYNPVRLDAFELEACDMIKVDAQGADLRILVGSMATILKFRPTVLFEMEPIPARLHGDTIEDAIEFFTQMDYQVTKLREGHYGVTDFVAVPK